MQLRVKALRRLLFIHAGEVCARELVALEASGRASSVRHRQSGVHEWVNQACNHSEYRPRVKDAEARTDGGEQARGERAQSWWKERGMEWWNQLIWGEMCRWRGGKGWMRRDEWETDNGKGTEGWQTARLWPMDRKGRMEDGGRGYECSWWLIREKIREMSRWGRMGGVVEAKDETPGNQMEVCSRWRAHDGLLMAEGLRRGDIETMMGRRREQNRFSVVSAGGYKYHLLI